MATELATGYVSIVPSARGFGQTLSRELGPQMGGVQGGITSSFGSMFRSVALAGAGVMATVGVGQFFKSAVEEAREANRVAAETATRIASTGASAWTSASQVEQLAGRLSHLVGVDDEVIQSGANLLLTFRNVKNEVGEGNDIFDRANGLALDMSAAFKQDLSSSAVQLGKALDNPIQGVSALQRVGVSFTESQKEQIRTLVESGQTLEAQKIILGELETQVGGTAAAIATPWDRFGVTVGNIKEQIGAGLIPVLDATATFLADRLPGAIEVVSGWFRVGRDAVESFVYTFRTGFTEDEGTLIETVALKVRDLAHWLTDELWPAIQQVVEAVGGWKEVLVIAAVVLAAILAPLATLTAAVIYAYTEFDGFRAVVDAVIRFFTTTVMPAVQRFAAYLAEQFARLVAWTQEHWAAIEEAVGHVLTAVRAAIDVWVGYVTMLWSAFGDELLNIAGLVWDQIALIVQTAIDLVRSVIEFVLAVINGDWGEAWQAIKDILSTTWEFITEYVGNALQVVGQLVEFALSGLRQLWDLAWQAIGAALEWAWGAIVGAVEAGVRAVVDFFAGLPGRAITALGDLAGTLLGVGQQALGSMLIGAVSAADGLWDFFGGLPRRIVDAIGNLGGVLIDAGEDIIRGLLRGIRNMVPNLRGALGGLAHDITSWKGPPEKDAVMLVPAGRLLMRGLIRGILGERGALAAALGTVTADIAAAPRTLGARSLVAVGATPDAPVGAGGVVQHNTFNILGVSDPTEAAHRTALEMRMPRGA